MHSDFFVQSTPCTNLVQCLYIFVNDQMKFRSTFVYHMGIYIIYILWWMWLVIFRNDIFSSRFFFKDMHQSLTKLWLVEVWRNWSLWHITLLVTVWLLLQQLGVILLQPNLPSWYPQENSFSSQICSQMQLPGQRNKFSWIEARTNHNRRAWHNPEIDNRKYFISSVILKCLCIKTEFY